MTPTPEAVDVTYWAYIVKATGYLTSIAGVWISVQRTEGTIKKKVAVFLGGLCAAWICWPWAAQFLHLPDGVAGFGVGLFGMAVIDRLFAGLEKVDVGEFVNRWLKGKSGEGKAGD